LPYPWITDGTWWITKPTTWTELDEMLDDAAASYRRALWHDQPDEMQIFTSGQCDRLDEHPRQPGRLVGGQARSTRPRPALSAGAGGEWAQYRLR
jgi:hypothetical protein